MTSEGRKSFLKNAGTLMAGTAFAQTISLAIYPLITRLYLPEDFGELEIFSAIFTILAGISCLKYDQAIILPKSGRTAKELTKLAILLNVFSCLIFGFIILLLVDKLDNWFSYELSKVFFYLIPITVFFTSLFNCIRLFALRSKEYKQISKAVSIKALVLSFSQIIIGISKLISGGLIVSQILSTLSYNFVFARSVFKRSLGVNFIFKKRLCYALLNRYVSFPKYAVAGSLANSLALYGTSFFVFKNFSIEVLGYFALANRLLSTPLTLISNAIGDIFLQKISEDRNLGRSGKKSYKEIFFPMASLCIIGALIGYWILPSLFSFLFGSNWSEAGRYSSVLIFLYSVRFLNTPFSNVYIVFDKQNLSLIGTIIQLLILLLTFIVAIKFDFSMFDYLVFFTITQSLFYVVYMYVGWRIVANSEIRYEKGN